MPGEQTWVVDDGAMTGSIDDLHGDELAAEWQHVELSTQSLVLGHNFRKSLPFGTPTGELEY